MTIESVFSGNAALNKALHTLSDMCYSKYSEKTVEWSICLIITSAKADGLPGARQVGDVAQL